MNWTDPAFGHAMKEQEPGNRARFLASVYSVDKESFAKVTPDQILIDEFSPEVYIELANQHLVPIAAVPAGIVLG